MLPDIVKQLPPVNQKRFEEARSNPNRPIATGERDDIAVALVQAWLFALGPSSLPLSVVFELDENAIGADGIFGDETRQAVIAFQRANGLKPDGMVGRNTLDKITERLRRTFPQPPVTRNASVTAVKRPFRCPPGALICAEPPR